MDPQEKAKELLKKMNVIHYMKLGGINSNSKGLPVSMHDDQIKECALNCVDEVLQRLMYSLEENAYRDDMTKKYWHKVKQEIERL